MKEWVYYGSDKLYFDVPEGAICSVYSPNPVKPAEDELSEIQNALLSPIGADLNNMVGPDSRVCIISDDVSRPTPVATVNRVLLPYLEELGVRKENIYFVMALGSHRTMTEAEIEAKLGADVVASYRVYQSAFKTPDDLLFLGETEEDRIPITVSRVVMDSDVRIGIGNIVPHNTLGWSGGCKILFPGVTSEETVCKFHLKAMMRGDEIIFGNPENSVRRDVERWAKKIGLSFIINTILNDSGKIYRVVAGDSVLAHRQGVKYAEDVFAVKVNDRPDIVVVDSHPSDCDFWQGTKGFNPSDVLLAKGGSALLVSPFFEGVGPHREYPYMVGRDDSSDILERIYRGDTEGLEGMDPLAVAVGGLISRMRQKFDMYVYSDGIGDDYLEMARIQRSVNISETLAELNKKYGNHAKIAVLRYGAEIVPILKD